MRNGGVYIGGEEQGVGSREWEKKVHCMLSPRVEHMERELLFKEGLAIDQVPEGGTYPT